MKRLRKVLAKFNKRGLKSWCRNLLSRWTETVLREEFEKLVARIDREATRIDRVVERNDRVTALQTKSIEWLARAHAEIPRGNSAPTGRDPLVSIVMPCRNRTATIALAIESVLAQTWQRWELLIIDDGSTDDLPATLSRYAGDSRIRLIVQAPTGVSAARNRGLQESAGEIITYLDTDNEWFPQYLSDVVQTFERDPKHECVYFAQLFRDRRANLSWIESVKFDRETFAREGGIDLNTFAHRRCVYEREGGFDVQLRRLVDWELIGRYTRSRDPLTVPLVSGIYYVAEHDSISVRESFAYNAHLVRKKLLRKIPRPLRVLYLTGDYPQLSESYVRTELIAMQRVGVEIEVWSEDPAPASPYPAEVPRHVGSVEEALDSFQPDLVHAHWLHVARNCAPLVAKRGLPLTVRGHGFEFSPELLRELDNNEDISGVFAFPHQLEQMDSKKLFATPAVFNGDWYPPSARKDRRLVLRCGAMLPTKDLFTFIDVAAQCPDHRFVLAGVTVKNQDELRRQLEEHNRALGNPVEFRCDLPYDQMYELMAEAGIYLHTYDLRFPFGMPISIAEAMATGAFAMTRESAAAAAYVGSAGAVYRNLEEAVNLVRATTRWSEDEWKSRQARAVEHAYANHSDIKHLYAMSDFWCQLTESNAVAVRRAA